MKANFIQTLFGKSALHASIMAQERATNLTPPGQRHTAPAIYSRASLCSTFSTKTTILARRVQASEIHLKTLHPRHQIDQSILHSTHMLLEVFPSQLHANGQHRHQKSHKSRDVELVVVSICTSDSDNLFWAPSLLTWRVHKAHDLNCKESTWINDRSTHIFSSGPGANTSWMLLGPPWKHCSLTQMTLSILIFKQCCHNPHTRSTLTNEDITIRYLAWIDGTQIKQSALWRFANSCLICCRLSWKPEHLPQWYGSEQLHHIAVPAYMLWWVWWPLQ